MAHIPMEQQQLTAALAALLQQAVAKAPAPPQSDLRPAGPAQYAPLAPQPFALTDGHEDPGQLVNVAAAQSQASQFASAGQPQRFTCPTTGQVFTVMSPPPKTQPHSQSPQLVSLRCFPCSLSPLHSPR